MSPQIILVMRHAEKPADRTDRGLAPAGHARAENLASYIPYAFGRPGSIFAAADTHHSARSRKTVEPLAAATSRPVFTQFVDEQYRDLANHLTGRGAPESPVVVCWHHEKIAKLMEALGAPVGSYPTIWPDELFDLILEMKRDAAGRVTVTPIREPF